MRFYEISNLVRHIFHLINYWGITELPNKKNTGYKVPPEYQQLTIKYVAIIYKNKLYYLLARYVWRCGRDFQEERKCYCNLQPPVNR